MELDPPDSSETPEKPDPPGSASTGNRDSRDEKAAETDTETARDASERDLRESIVEALSNAGRRVVGIEALAGDVSVRRYFRLQLTPPPSADDDSAILAWYPPSDRGTCERFRATTELLDGVQVPVPKILDIDPDRAWCLIQDLGDQTLVDLRTEESDPWHRLSPFFEHALELLVRIASLATEPVAALNPPLDTDLLRQELDKTLNSFARPRGLDEPDGLTSAFDQLCHHLGNDRTVACHRDFMARNLVPQVAEGSTSVAVLDHQDLRVGPEAYDLASLLNDSLFPPPTLEQRWVARFKIDPLSYHRAAAQRTLKAIGTYAAFAARGSDRHLPLIAPTFERAIGHLSQVPETSTIAPRLAEAWAGQS